MQPHLSLPIAFQPTTQYNLPSPLMNDSAPHGIFTMYLEQLMTRDAASDTPPPNESSNGSMIHDGPSHWTPYTIIYRNRFNKACRVIIALQHDMAPQKDLLERLRSPILGRSRFANFALGESSSCVVKRQVKRQTVLLHEWRYRRIFSRDADIGINFMIRMLEDSEKQEPLDDHRACFYVVTLRSHFVTHSSYNRECACTGSSALFKAHLVAAHRSYEWCSSNHALRGML